MGADVTRMRVQIDEAESLLQQSLRNFREAIAAAHSGKTPLHDDGSSINPARADKFFEDLAGRIVRGILVHGFENDQAVERILDPMKPVIANTIRSALLENESAETNPAKPIARVGSDESEVTVDRGELVSALNRYITHMHSWKKSEFTDVLADAMLRFFGRKSS